MIAENAMHISGLVHVNINVSDFDRSASIGWHLPFRFTQTRDARALYGKRRVLW